MTYAIIQSADAIMPRRPIMLDLDYDDAARLVELFRKSDAERDEPAPTYDIVRDDDGLPPYLLAGQ